MVQVIVYLPGQSAFTPRVDEFRRCGQELGRRLVWKGRPLTVEEFNKEFPGIVENSRLKWSYEPIVEIVEIVEKKVPAKKPADEVIKVENPVIADPAPGNVAPAAPVKKARGRPPKKAKAPAVPSPQLQVAAVVPAVVPVAGPRKKGPPVILQC